MTRNAEKVINEFKLRGVSIADWARKQGYSPDLVYRVLKADHIPTRGKSHLIAVKLGLKSGLLEQNFDFLDEL